MRLHQPLVLVADDDRDTRELYRACFDTSGYRTAEATTGSQAMVSALQSLPEVLLTDYVLPDVDGLTLARRLKQDPRTAAIRILMVTGYGSPELETVAAEAGIERVLLKPALPQAVMREVARTLGRPAQRKPLRIDPPAAASGHFPSTQFDGTSALARVRDEFVALPGLSLTAEQARLVFSLDRDAVYGILNTLVTEGFLQRSSHGAFYRSPR